MYCDLTLRDGSHAIKHQLTKDMIISHCKFAENTGIKVVEVGHGNGLGGSSILIGKSLLSDRDMLITARSHLKNTKLSVHIIPGLATIKDIDTAIDVGVDIFRIASYCTEASISKTYIEYLKKKNKEVYGVLMMSASCSTITLYEEAEKMKKYGADAIIIMDSSGSYTQKDVVERVSKLVTLEIPIGFHGHNNLHLATANSLAAIEAGSSIIDVTINGFGAGAGNTPLEVMLYLCNKDNIDPEKVLEYSEQCLSTFFKPTSSQLNILTAKYKLFSGFEKHIYTACEKYKVSCHELVKKMVDNELVSGQEDFIYILANSLKDQENN